MHTEKHGPVNTARNNERVQAVRLYLLESGICWCKIDPVLSMPAFPFIDSTLLKTADNKLGIFFF
jgi:hypothetical protein